jgi:hypothetical protein
MPVTAKPDGTGRDGPAPESGDETADLRRRLKETEARLAAEKVAREEQERLARSMARAARSEAAEGEALAKNAAELRQLLKAQQDEHAAARRELERQRADIEALVDAEVKKSLVPELERRLAESRGAWDEERQRERSRLAETWKHETEQRIATAEAAWRENESAALEEATRELSEQHKRELAAARKEWEGEHDAAMADRDRHWRERLDHEVRETREAMEKIWARAQDPEADDAAVVGLRGMRDRLVLAAHRRRIMGYRLAILTLLLALTAAFAFHYPKLETVLIAPDADPATGTQRPDAEAPAIPAGKSADEPPQETLRPLGLPARATAPPSPPNPKAQARIKALESQLTAMRERLEAEEKRANDSEDAIGRANAAHKRANLQADRAFRARLQTQAKTIAELKATIRILRTRLEAANAATTSSAAPE